MGKGAAKRADAAAEAQTRIAEKQFDLGAMLLEAAKPAREQAQNTYMGLSKGNIPGIQSYVAPQLNMTNMQFAQAKKAIDAMPPGGAKEAARRDLELQRARGISDVLSGGVAEGTTRLASMGWGGTQAGVGSYGQASGAYGNIAKMYSEQASATRQTLGGLASAAGGAAAGFA